MAARFRSRLAEMDAVAHHGNRRIVGLYRKP
jgi:hypothetical protein